MKTWRICLLVVSTIAAVCAQAEPAAPTELDVAPMSSTSVFLRWKWTDKDLSLAGAKFLITATTEGSDPKTANVDGKLYAVLDNLQAGKEYEIQVALVKADGKSQAGDSRKITMEGKDFVTPVITKTENGDKTDMNSVPYTTTWEFNEPKDLSQYEVLYCTSTCEVQTAKKGETSSTKNLEYFSDYTVVVVAVLKDAATGDESRVVSPVSAFKTVTGKPGKVENVKIDQKPDTLDVKISWSPPQQPNGNIESYNLQILAAEKIVVSQNVKEIEFTYSMKTKEQIIESFSVTIQAVNNGDDNDKNGDVVTEQYNLKKPEPPTELKLKTCKPESLEIEIVRKSEAALVFQVVEASKKPVIVKSPEVPLDGFQAFTEVPVSVAACVPLDGDNVFCGASKDGTFRTNVAAPSMVQALSFEANATQVELSWKEPEKREGPIDGYVVRITAKKTNETTEAVVDGTTLSYSFTEVKNCTEYGFAALAFNIDLVSKGKVNGTLSEVVSYSSENCESPKSFPTWAIVLIVLAVMGVVGGGAYYYVRVYRQ